MNIILFGAPGSGKGTQAVSLTESYGLRKVSLGDILREEVKKDSMLGARVKEYMQQGVLVPDEIVAQVIEDCLSRIDGFILDGYPRNINQAQHLDAVLTKINKKIDVVIYLRVDEKTILHRLQLRQVCSSCGALYHPVNMPARVEGICDVCSGKLIQRADDTPEVIHKRWQVYCQESKPLLDFYRAKGIVCEVDARREKDIVFEELKDLIDNGECLEPR